MPALIQLAALTFMNKLLPRANVNWGAAILGGVVTAFMLEIAQVGLRDASRCAS